MVQGLIGKKIGMTQVFDDNGVVTPVTVLEVGPCVVVDKRTPEKHGYGAVQLGLVDATAGKRATKPWKGLHEKAGVPPTRALREFRVEGDDELNPGDQVLVDIFDGIDKVDIISTSKGKGFQGVIRRHNFGGGKASHGSMHHRAPGSIGQSAFPSKVFKGMRGPGRMGGDRTTLKNVRVVRIDAEKNILLVRGAVPGARGAMVLVQKSGAPRKRRR